MEQKASGDLGQYVSTVEAVLAPPMGAGRRLLALFTRYPALVHAGWLPHRAGYPTGLATPPGWRLFSRFCREDAGGDSAGGAGGESAGEAVLERFVRRLPVRIALALLGATPDLRSP